ncbi:uncharacterized [Tachysurus ichikawai]
MATGSLSVLHAHVRAGSYSGHGGVRCYASHGSMCIPKRVFEEGKCRRNTFSIFPLQGVPFTEMHINTDSTTSPSLAQCAMLKQEQ